jgi:hypothetical protein
MVPPGDPPLTFEGYIELLLSACSTYDKSNTTTDQSGQRNVYAATMQYDEEVCYNLLTHSLATWLEGSMQVNPLVTFKR